MKHTISLTIFILILLSVTTIGFYIVFTSNPYQKESISPSMLSSSIQKGIDFLKSRMDENGRIYSLSITDWAAIAVASTEENLSDWEKTRQYLIKSTNTINETNVIDWQRHCLALIAFNIDPDNVSGINITQKLLDFYQNEQMGQEQNIYDDIFGIIALRSCGIQQTQDIITNTLNTILETQKQDGSWGDVDTTAAAIIALSSYEYNHTEGAIQQGLEYIKNKQDTNGGFHSWGKTNTATTSWAICAINAVYENAAGVKWTKQNHTPIDYLLNMQKENGSFLYDQNTSLNNEWMTSYALIALSGNTFVTG